MPTQNESSSLTREKLIDLLNEDLAREFQAIIAYVNYSQVLKGAAYMNIAAELAVHATEELAHAITLSNQIDYLGGMPTTIPKPVKTSEKASTDAASSNATNSASSPPPSRSARSSSRSRTTRSPSPPPSASTSPT
jgi:hypothetical protein